MNKKNQITVFLIIVLLLFFSILIKNNESEHIEITETNEKNEIKTTFNDSTSKKISLETQSNMKVSKVKESNIE